MVKAFLIVWTLVAGLAAGSLMYIVGWRPQASSVAQQVSSAKPGAQPVLSADASSHQSADADAGPTSTGSIGPGRSATRAVRRVDGVASPTGSEPAADRAQDVAAASDRGAAGARPNVPNAKPALSPPANPPAGSAKKPEIVRLPVGDDAEADPTAQRTQAAERRTNDRGAALGTPTPPPAASRDAAQSRSRPEATPVARPQDNGARSEPDTASASTEATPAKAARVAGAARAERRAARAAERAARAAARQEERTRLADAGESPAEVRRRLLEARQQARAERRQARTERRSRMARDGGLETLLDEFSRSGADFLHERTIRVGTRYLVERTTRHGTQYFYEQNGR